MLRFPSIFRKPVCDEDVRWRAGALHHQRCLCVCAESGRALRSRPNFKRALRLMHMQGEPAYDAGAVRTIMTWSLEVSGVPAHERALECTRPASRAYAHCASIPDLDLAKNTGAQLTATERIAAFRSARRRRCWSACRARERRSAKILGLKGGVNDRLYGLAVGSGRSWPCGQWRAHHLQTHDVSLHRGRGAKGMRG